MAINSDFDSTHFIADAVNILLQTISQPPIETLADIDNILEAQIAKTTIMEAKKSILSGGWDINSDTNYPFYPTIDGYISVPPDVLDIKSGSTIVVRDWMLYDKENHTRKFTEEVLCDVRWNLDFNTLPHPLRYYITLVAAKQFQARMISDTDVYAFTEDDIAEAKILAKRSNSYTSEFNMLDSVTMSSR